MLAIAADRGFHGNSLFYFASFEAHFDYVARSSFRNLQSDKKNEHFSVV